jgi:BirA family biotin operon repressor/biotin-[acetyl-CoA-carboxylase] ligase
MPLRSSATSAVCFDLARLRRETFIAGVEFHLEVDSTNNRAIALAGQPDGDSPLLVLAERQTLGRGRGGNVWWSAPGGLTFSLLFDAQSICVPIDRWPQISLSAALAIRQTIADLLPGETVQVKWPNDVFLRGRKVSGILVEIPPVRPEKLIVGIGLNVNNSFVDAPAKLRAVATSLIDVAQSAQDEEIANCNPFDRTDVLVRLLQAIASELSHLQHAAPNLATRWRPHCFLDGRIIHITSGPTTHVGLCQGIDNTGALILVNQSRSQRLISGVVTSIGLPPLL